MGRSILWLRWYGHIVIFRGVHFWQHASLPNISGLICSNTAWTKSALTATNRCPMPYKAIEAVLALSARRHAHSTPPPRRLPAPGCSREPQNLPVALSALPDEPWRTAQCAPHPPPAVTSPPCIPQSRPGAGVPPRTPTSVVRVCTMPPLIWRYCKMFFTESAARGLIDVIDVIDHAWRPIDTPDSIMLHGAAARPRWQRCRCHCDCRPQRFSC